MWTPRGLQEGFGSLVAHRYLRPLRTTLQQIAIGLLRFESSGGATASVTSDITTFGKQSCCAFWAEACWHEDIKQDIMNLRS